MDIRVSYRILGLGGGKVNAIEGVEGMRKHAPTRGVWGHAPPEMF